MPATVPIQEYDAVVAENADLRTRLAAAERRIAWFTRELFGSKSEKRLAIDPALQPSLFAGLIEDAPPPPATETVEIQRRKKTRDGAVNDTGLRFDASVPVRVIEVAPPDDLENGEIIAIHSTFRLAQRRASYEVLEYRCPVIKASPEAAPQTTPVPGAIFTGSLADVSFLAGLLVDKFAFHLPLYRQHQRLAAGGITLARATLTQLVARSAALLAPIHLAQLEHVLTSRVLAMDETPIKAGHKTKGKLESGYFWPLYGDADEISFTFSPSRGRAHIEDTLAEHFSGTLVTDGYAAYARYAEARPGVTHAQCWSHTRRGFERALDSDPQAQHALALIGDLYQAEAEMREKQREGPDKQADRTRHCEPAVRAFWQWCDSQCQRLDLEPSHPLAKAIAYALERRASLEVFLGDPDVPIDTNHLERGLRPIPMGRRNWLFCWSEVGATHVGIIQSLISTCRLHGVDPYTYLVDVLQRVGLHPASRVIELTPRLWKEHFAENPLRSDID
ncbi:IS66 family transposase [Salinisphaera sp. SWV1]|uniref:IS66 family transposase n=1 Tax=Salinisphaera sp. SWV1 TaxID=3454139 RepID=UPI003F861507